MPTEAPSVLVNPPFAVVGDGNPPPEAVEALARLCLAVARQRAEQRREEASQDE